MRRFTSLLRPALLLGVLLASGGATRPLPAPILPGDAADDAAGEGQLFESIVAPGYTDYIEGSSSVVLADFDKDGRIDIFGIYDEPKTALMLLNRGDFKFERHVFTIAGSTRQPGDLGVSANIANVADFNKDGFLDIFIGYSRGRGESLGNMLLISDGAFDRFVEVGAKMGVANAEAYNRQSSIGDVDRDGWLDIAVGADNIGGILGGVPQQRLYVFKPAASGKFTDGSFESVGGTPTVPGFGAKFACDAKVDMASPGISLRDVDNDGDLDLAQNYHSDMLFTKWNGRCPSGEYRQGAQLWRNDLVETGKFGFTPINDNGFTENCRNSFDEAKALYVPVGHCASLPYVFWHDLDNDGRLDILATGASDYTWHVNTDLISGRAWKNLGGGKFAEATGAMGLETLNWTYGQWSRYWGTDFPYTSKQLVGSIRTTNQPSRMIGRTLHDGQPYGSDLVVADFDNDGWQDIVFIHKHEMDGAWGIMRNVLLMNNGDGTYRPTTTQFSGIDSNGPSGEAADLNGDGLLDLVLLTDPRNSAPTPDMPKDRFRQRIMWNTGNHGGRANHWLHLRFTGVSDAELIGARIEARAAGSTKLLGMRPIHSNHSYKSGGSLDAHFGLGQVRSVDLTVTLLDGRTRRVAGVKADRRVVFDIAKGVVADARIASR